MLRAHAREVLGAIAELEVHAHDLHRPRVGLDVTLGIDEQMIPFLESARATTSGAS